MHWYDKSKSQKEAQAASASPPPYGDNAAIQKREDLVPSRLRKRRKKKCKKNCPI
jgi:hypothetical protein